MLTKWWFSDSCSMGFDQETLVVSLLGRVALQTEAPKCSPPTTFCILGQTAQLVVTNHFVIGKKRNLGGVLDDVSRAFGIRRSTSAWVPRSSIRSFL